MTVTLSNGTEIDLPDPKKLEAVIEDMEADLKNLRLLRKSVERVRNRQKGGDDDEAK